MSHLLAGFLAFLLSSTTNAPTTEITFLVAADPHYGQDQWADDEAQNKAAIDRMNAIPGTAYPASVGGGTVGTPLGVLVAGDLTDTGEYTNWYGYWWFGWLEGFQDDYGIGGAGRIAWEVYEGYGNHDIHSPADGTVHQGIRDRNLLRAGLTHVSSNGLHYSLDWPLGDTHVHVVNLNIYPGGAGDAEDSLAFLIDDLGSHVGASGRPVVLYHHYGFDSFSMGWWTGAERDAYWQAIQDYNVIGIFHGHNHNTSHRLWNGIDTFAVGTVQNQMFVVVRITETEMTVAERLSNSWNHTWQVDIWTGSALATVRNGRGINTDIYRNVTLPVLGTDWIAEIDGGSIGSSGLTYVFGYADPLDPGLLTSFGELLVDPASPWAFTSVAGDASGLSRHTIPIPFDLGFVGISLGTQGLLGNMYGSLILTNAIDLVLGW